MAMKYSVLQNKCMPVSVNHAQSYRQFLKSCPRTKTSHVDVIAMIRGNIIQRKWISVVVKDRMQG
jgi:hypothetical protein